MVKNGITLLSSHDPESRCRRFAETVTVSDSTLYFCPSPLYGYGLEILLERIEAEAPNSVILCVENDPELFKLYNEGKELKGKKLSYTNKCKAEELSAFIRETWGPSLRVFRKVEMLKFTGGVQLAPDLYNSLYESIQHEIIMEWSNALTLTMLGRLYIRNALRNLSLISHWKSISELSFGDSPVLVLGAGPSLDGALDKIEKEIGNDLYFLEKRPFKIVCVDTCLGALKDRNIIPDLTIVLECQHWNLRDFIGCKNWSKAAAFDLSALSQSTRSCVCEEGYLFMTPWTELAIFNRMKEANILPDVVPPLGSVGLTAMEIAQRLTTGKITTAGLDFCFTLDKSHARGTPGHKNKLNMHNRFGGLINTVVFGTGVVREDDKYTNPAMRNYRMLFEQEFNGKERRNFTQRHRDTEGNLGDFVQSEIERLNELRDILIGKKGKEKLETLIRECDFVWAHFPDYAGGVEPNCEDISFLNRVRVEIDSMLEIFNHEPH